MNNPNNPPINFNNWIDVLTVVEQRSLSRYRFDDKISFQFLDSNENVVSADIHYFSILSNSQREITERLNSILSKKSILTTLIDFVKSNAGAHKNLHEGLEQLENLRNQMLFVTAFRHNDTQIIKSYSFNTNIAGADPREDERQTKQRAHIDDLLIQLLDPSAVINMKGKLLRLLDEQDDKVKLLDELIDFYVNVHALPKILLFQRLDY
ncbi:hypothetical protein [Siphonobacter sp.]|uniref:hypothetical protein n=1 Tax=Siphonobacter sp. TaxID=1869184 RepID=UPI003B3B71B5